MDRPLRRLLGILLGLCPLIAGAAEGLPEGWCLAPFPSFERPAVQIPISGANRTALAVARVQEGLLVPASRAEFEALGMGVEDFARRAAVSATAILASLEPELRRDRRQVVEAAVLRSADPRLPMVLLAPGFASRFKSWFGSPVFAAAPNPSTVYVFASVAGSHGDYGVEIVGGYRNSPRPVSLELFEIGRSGSLRAVGGYEP